MTRLIKLLGMALFAAGTVACSTVEGMGEDIEDAGEGVQEAADQD